MSGLGPVPLEPRPPCLGFHAVAELVPDWYLEQPPPPQGLRLEVLDVNGQRCTWDVHLHIAPQLLHHLRRDPRVRALHHQPFGDPPGR